MRWGPVDKHHRRCPPHTSVHSPPASAGMSVPLLRDLTHISFLNVTHMQHYKVPAVPLGLLHPDFLAFFTLHTHNGQLLYVSETTVASKHAQFGPLSLESAPKNTFKIILLLWISCPGLHQYNLFSELRLDLRNLVRTLHCDSHRYTENAPVWSILDSKYCLEPHLRASPGQNARKPDAHDAKEKLSYTVDDVRNLSNLMAGIRDFNISKNLASAEINSLQNTLRGEERNVQELRHRSEALDASLAKLDSKIDLCNSKTLAIKNKCKKIELIIKHKYPVFKALCTEQLDIIESQIPPIYETLEKSTYPDLVAHIRRLVSVVDAAYPIHLLANTGRYCIAGLEFPVSIREILSMCYSHGPALTVQSSCDAGELPMSVINSGISHIISLMSILASILNLSLKHDIALCHSKSYIVNCGAPALGGNDSGEQLHHCETQYPLYYDEDGTQVVKCLPGTSQENEKRNPGFEAGLVLLKNNLLQLSADATALFSHYRKGDPTRAIATVPLECQDNFLWHLHFLLLYVTAA